jgi:hypothetical protein
MNKKYLVKNFLTFKKIFGIIKIMMRENSSKLKIFILKEKKYYGIKRK